MDQIKITNTSLLFFKFERQGERERQADRAEEPEARIKEKGPGNPVPMCWFRPQMPTELPAPKK